MRTFAEIKNSRAYYVLDIDPVVAPTADDPNAVIYPLPETEGYWLDVTGMSPRPDRNWIFHDDGTFTEPVWKWYARIENGVVMELLHTDYRIEELFVPEYVWIDVTDNDPMPDQRWTYANGQFSPPPPPPNTAPQTKIDLINFATMQIGILTDATDPDVVDEVNPDDVSLLLAWKKYRQALRSVDTSKVPVTWPDQPALAYSARSGDEV